MTGNNGQRRTWYASQTGSDKCRSLIYAPEITYILATVPTWCSLTLAGVGVISCSPLNLLEKVEVYICPPPNSFQFDFEKSAGIFGDLDWQILCKWLWQSEIQLKAGSKA